LLFLTVLHTGEDTSAFRTADTLAIHALPAIAAGCTVINQPIAVLIKTITDFSDRVALPRLKCCNPCFEGIEFGLEGIEFSSGYVTAAGSRITFGSLNPLRAGVTGIAFQSLDSLRSGISGIAFQSLDSLRSGISGIAFLTFWSHRSLRANRSGFTLRPLKTDSPCRPGRAGLTFWSRYSLGSRRPLRSWIRLNIIHLILQILDSFPDVLERLTLGI
jgi:hypothetical protein